MRVLLWQASRNRSRLALLLATGGAFEIVGLPVLVEDVSRDRLIACRDDRVQGVESPEPCL
jgi:hypothetical protein